MLGGGADELIEGVHDVGEGQGGAFLARELDHGEEAGFAEFVAALVPGFGDAVGVNYEEVVGLDSRDPRYVIFLYLDAQWDVVGFQALDGAIRATENRGIVDLVTLEYSQKVLISTIDDVAKIAEDGKKQREDARKAIATMQLELRNKLTH